MAAENTLVKGRYQQGDLIGSGSMGDVYIGTDTLTGERVAIKQLRLEPAGNISQTVERFLREGEVLRRLNHPNIVKVLATTDENRRHFIIMEYVGGGSLADLLERQRQLPIAQVVSIGLELSDALSRAHHLKILHRDIKPSNILLAEDGTPRLTDFGLARVGQMPGLTETGSILGTLYYLSPEAIENRKVNERSDLWCLGVVLYQMLTGQLPFEGETPFEVVWAIKNQSLPILENLRGGIPPALANLVRRMLRKDNAARIDSARQVGVELEAVQKELATIEGEGKPSTNGGGGRETAAAESRRIITVVIADDHAVVRQGLRMFIDLQEDMQVVGEGTNGAEAVQLVEQHRPDVVLLDLVMPEMNGIEATRKIKAVHPTARILILTSFGEDTQIIPAIQAGAQGYLLKDIRPDHLIQAVREACQGKTQLHPDIAQKLMSIVAGKTNPAPDTRE